MEFDWVKNAGGSHFETAYDIAVDGSGNSFAVGFFDGTSTFGSTTFTTAGSDDIFIAKINASGNFIWVKQAGGTLYDVGRSIALDGSGNIYITGDFQGTTTFGSTTLTSAGSRDIFIAKLDASGNFVWAKRAGGSDYDYGYSIAKDGSGNVYVTGYFQGNANFGSSTLTSAGSDDIFIAKLDVSGNFVWVKKAGGNAHDHGNGIAVNGSGNVYVTGYFGNTASFGSITLTVMGGVGHNEMFIAKLDVLGNFIWVKQGSATTYSVGNATAVDGSGNVYVTGEFAKTATFGSDTFTSAGEQDIYISKLDASGNFLWARRVGDSQIDYGKGIDVDGSGNAFVTGFFDGTATFGSTALTSAGGWDIFVTKIDASGNFIWVKQAGGTSSDKANAVVVDGSGNVFVVGSFLSDPMTFGSITLSETFDLIGCS